MKSNDIEIQQRHLHRMDQSRQKQCRQVQRIFHSLKIIIMSLLLLSWVTVSCCFAYGFQLQPLRASAISSELNRWTCFLGMNICSTKLHQRNGSDEWGLESYLTPANETNTAKRIGDGWSVNSKKRLSYGTGVYETRWGKRVRDEMKMGKIGFDKERIATKEVSKIEEKHIQDEMDMLQIKLKAMSKRPEPLPVPLPDMMMKKGKQQSTKLEPIVTPSATDTRKKGASEDKGLYSKSPFNVVLTHCTADFDSLASAVGLAKLWSTAPPSSHNKESTNDPSDQSTSFQTSENLPTYVVLPRGAHPSVHRFLALHKHLFPIQSLRALPSDLSMLNRIGLVDAQRRDRIGPAEFLLPYANRVVIVDHHIDGESDIPEATDYVVEKVGSVSTMIVERLEKAGLDLTEAEATLLALGIHADTGSLCFDNTTPRDVFALGYVMKQGASQAAIAEHVKTSLSQEQQGVLTQTLINTNSTIIHGVTVSTVLLSTEGFINGLAAVTQDALELSSSDVFILAVVHDTKSGKGKSKSESKKNYNLSLQSKLLENKRNEIKQQRYSMETEAWKGGEDALKRLRLRAGFDKIDTDGSGFLGQDEVAAALATSGVITTKESVETLMKVIDTDNDGRVDFEEFVIFSQEAELRCKLRENIIGKKSATMTVIGRAKAGVNLKSVNLNTLFQQFGGGGHAKAASCTVRLGDEGEACGILQGLVDEIIETSLMKQPTVGDFMTSPVLSAKQSMTEKQVEYLFNLYDVRALPVIDDSNNVVGLVTYKEVAAAKQRLWNKEQKRLRQETKKKMEQSSNDKDSTDESKGYDKREKRKLGSALKGWMKQHIQTVEASFTMAEAENVLLENNVGCIPVVADGTKKLIGMVTRTDLLRQHRYYPSLHYNNKGFANPIAGRKPLIELRKKLKMFDPDV